MSPWSDNYQADLDVPALPQPGKARVLAIDDDDGQLGVVRAILEAAGYEVTSTADPRQAQSLIKSSQPDAILLDLLMPEVSGWELLETIRSRPETRTIPVLLLSGQGKPAQRVRGLRAGADDFMVKPLDSDELLVRLEARIAGKRREDSGMFGCLGADWTARDLMQSLERHAKTGEVKIYSDNLWGTVLLRGGKAVAARYGPYFRQMAVQALLEIRQGHFTFSPKDIQAPSAPGIRFGPLAVEEAWIHEELGSRGVYLPPTDANLEVRGSLTPVPSDLEGLPVEAVYEQVRLHPRVLMNSLFTEEFGTPNQVRLAVAWMVEEGIMGLSGARPPE